MTWTWARRRLLALTHRDLRLFFIGESTSTMGSSMASVAVAFAVLDNGGSQSDLGYVMSARIVPMVVLLLVGGAVADRFGPRRIMIAADALRFASQGVLATWLLSGRPTMGVFVVLLGIWGVGEAFYTPARAALIPRIAATGASYDGKLRDANALAGLAGSVSSVAGPALAGIAVAVAGSGVVVAIDAATYAVSLMALALLRMPRWTSGTATGPDRAILSEGWEQFRSRPWLWVTTLQFTLFNLLVWAPFLVLGPVVAHERLGGARDWGLVMAFYGAGAVAGGLVSMGGRTPRRPLVAATVATAGWALPSAVFAAGLPLVCLVGAALVAGVGAAVCGILYATTNQEHLPGDVLGRVTSITTVGAFALGPVGLAAAGPVAATVGSAAVLGFGALWQVATCVMVLAVPDVRRLRAGGTTRVGGEHARPPMPADGRSAE
jgi:MFS family permease